MNTSHPMDEVTEQDHRAEALAETIATALTTAIGALKTLENVAQVAAALPEGEYALVGDRMERPTEKPRVHRYADAEYLRVLAQNVANRLDDLSDGVVPTDHI